MRTLIWAGVALFVVAGSCATAGVAGEATGMLKPILDKPESEQFKDAPARWRGYLLQARAAEAVEDPLQRCLAYPDLPGNRWPPGHAKAHCRFHSIEVMDLAEIDAYLQRNDLGGLEDRMDAYLAKHFSASDFGEDIHIVFAPFGDANDETDRISSAWLAAAPRSAYANLARGKYFQDMAWNSRGGEWASKTPREQLRQMSEYAEQALPYLRKAADIEPKLMPAYVAMLDLGMVDSRRELEREAVRMADRQDPACLDMARQRMQSLQPRWGGSYEGMLSFAAELARHVAERPQLAIHIAAPYGDLGDRMVAEKEYTKEAMEVLDIAISTGSNESHLHDAATMAGSLPEAVGGSDGWKQFALLLQESRFDQISNWTRRDLARRLVRAEPEWSLRHATRAAASEPDDAYGQYLLGAGYYNTRQFEAAEHHYLLAAEDADRRRDALRELSSMWLFDAGLDPDVAASKARPYIDRLLEAHPDDGRGWLLRINEEGMSTGRTSQENVDAFLRHADRNDPRQAHVVKQIETARERPVPVKAR